MMVEITLGEQQIQQRFPQSDQRWEWSVGVECCKWIVILKTSTIWNPLSVELLQYKTRCIGSPSWISVDQGNSFSGQDRVSSAEGVFAIPFVPFLRIAHIVHQPRLDDCSLNKSGVYFFIFCAWYGDELGGSIKSRSWVITHDHSDTPRVWGISSFGHLARVPLCMVAG